METRRLKQVSLSFWVIATRVMFVLFLVLLAVIAQSKGFLISPIVYILFAIGMAILTVRRVRTEMMRLRYLRMA